MVKFSYDFSKDFPDKLILQKDAQFQPGTTYLRLTKTDASGNPQSNSVGRAVCSKPVKFKNGGSQADFETTLQFSIDPAGSTIPAAGLTFFIAPVRHPVPKDSVGGYYGIFNTTGTTPKVFAVVLDIQKHDWDPTYKHVGINIESPIPNCLMRVDAVIENDVTATINYAAATKEITVEVSAGAKKFKMTYVYDLGTVLNETVWVGISGATGEHIAIHDLLSWSFSFTDV